VTFSPPPPFHPPVLPSAGGHSFSSRSLSLTLVGGSLRPALPLDSAVTLCPQLTTFSKPLHPEFPPEASPIFEVIFFKSRATHREIFQTQEPFDVSFRWTFAPPIPLPFRPRNQRLFLPFPFPTPLLSVPSRQDPFLWGERLQSAWNHFFFGSFF